MNQKQTTKKKGSRMDAKQKIREALEVVGHRGREIEGTLKDAYNCAKVLPQINAELASVSKQIADTGSLIELGKAHEKVKILCERKSAILEKLQALEDVGTRLRMDIEGCTATALEEINSVLHLVSAMATR